MSSVIALTFLSYSTYASLLKWISLSVLSYFGIVLFVQIPWNTVMHDTFLPSISLSVNYLMMIVAVLGTTISPYLFFWQLSIEVEEQRTTLGEEPVRKAPQQARSQFEKI